MPKSLTSSYHAVFCDVPSVTWLLYLRQETSDDWALWSWVSNTIVVSPAISKSCKKLFAFHYIFCHHSSSVSLLDIVKIGLWLSTLFFSNSTQSTNSWLHSPSWYPAEWLIRCHSVMSFCQLLVDAGIFLIFIDSPWSPASGTGYKVFLIVRFASLCWWFLLTAYIPVRDVQNKDTAWQTSSYPCHGRNTISFNNAMGVMAVHSVDRCQRVKVM